MPPPPGTFSTLTGCPRNCERRGASMRARMSSSPPAPRPTPRRGPPPRALLFAWPYFAGALAERSGTTEQIQELLQRFQVLDEVRLLLAVQPEAEVAVVVVDHGRQVREAAVVIEAALLVRPQPGERRRAVLVRRRAVRLERVDAHLLRRVQILPGLRIGRRHVAGRALAPALEHFLSAPRRRDVEAALGSLGRGDGELIEVQCRQLAAHEIGRAAGIERTALRRHRVLVRIVEPLVEERSRAVHLGRRDIGVPVRHRAESGPGVEVHAGKTKRGGYQRARLSAVGPEGPAVLVQYGVEATRTPARQHL